MNHMQTIVMQLTRANGSVLKEYFSNDTWYMELDDTRFLMYGLKQLSVSNDSEYWSGYLPEELLKDGRDILGEMLLAQGEPSFAIVQSLLPPITNGAYCFLSGAASWGGVRIDPMGQIFPQSSGNLRQPDPMFSPVMVDGYLGEIVPFQFLLDKKYPMLLNIHTDGCSVLEFLYFVEPCDPDRDPIVWIRTKRYMMDAPQECNLRYDLAAMSRRTSRQIEANTLQNALADTVSYWHRFVNNMAVLTLPETQLQNVVYGTMMACATTFTADHAHYGHLHYGDELHDHFPPNYIWTIEACCLLGQLTWARRIWQHLMTYVLNDFGRFIYRQGEHEIFGASAVEYAQILFLAQRYAESLQAENWSSDDWGKLMGMGRILLSNCVPCPEADGKVLVVMCAEADTNTRVHAYLNNNLWTIRGLRAMADLMTAHGRSAEAYRKMAALLEKNLRDLLPANTLRSPYGPLVPFRFGYTAMPWTLSNCHRTSEPLPAKTFRQYLTPSHMRSQGSDQDLTENTYANYRYYLEILSAMLLPAEEAAAIVNMREDLGGEYLAMTRFYNWLDDWPVIHYARYLLEVGRIEKYLLLLYAHTAHHGNPDLMCYYEQVSTQGDQIAPDCLPSLLTTAIMTAWMFAYETVQTCQLQLLSAIPLAWFEAGFSAYGIGFSGGSVDLAYKDNILNLHFSEPLKDEAILHWRHGITNLTGDINAISAVDGNRIYIKPGATSLQLIFEKPTHKDQK